MPWCGVTLSRVPNDERSRRIARWLAAGAVALIAYGSLYPFHFSMRAPAGIVELGTALSLRRPTRGDLVANLLLYVPLGVTLVPALRLRSPPVALAVALGAGLALSIGIETLQLFVPGRNASVSDVVLNAISSVAGAAAALAYARTGRDLARRGLHTGNLPLAPLGVLALWLGYRWVPFVPTIDWQKYKDALKPLVRWEDFGWLSTARYALGWLVAAHALRLLWRAAGRGLALAALVAATLVAQVVVVGRVVRPPEFVALALVALAAPWLARRDERRSAGLLLALAVPVVIAHGLEPFQFAATPGPFSWLPLRNSLSNALELNLLALLEKAFLYGALLWLITCLGAPVTVAVLAVAPLLALLELAQRWLPGRSAEITDPLLAIALGLLLAAARTTPAVRAADPSADN